MDDSSKQNLKCPVGESECLWLEEIEKLRSQVGELTKLVSTDALTGLHNYRHFKELLQTEMDRSKRSGIPTTLVKIDLDQPAWSKPESETPCTYFPGKPSMLPVQVLVSVWRYAA